MCLATRSQQGKRDYQAAKLRPASVFGTGWALNSRPRLDRTAIRASNIGKRQGSPRFVDRANGSRGGWTQVKWRNWRVCQGRWAVVVTVVGDGGVGGPVGRECGMCKQDVFRERGMTRRL
jgi:hypothetical protein